MARWAIMGELKAKSRQQITLKEAARISGYAPDYIGQLIRKGKIPGEQVYSHVAWVTTEEALRLYMEGGSRKGDLVEYPETAAQKALDDDRLIRMLRGVLYGVSSIAVVFVVFLFYVFSVSVDHRLTSNSLIGTSSADVATSVQRFSQKPRYDR